MISVRTSNVNLALPEAARLLLLHGQKTKTRNGEALVARGCFSTTYSNPRERVLFNPLRDANPFFHLMEAIWMFAGRNDVNFPVHFNSNFGDYSDNGIHFHGAYGFRWRKWFKTDQIRNVIQMIDDDRETRRAVIGIYDPEVDHSATTRGGKDIPCNLAVSFHVHGNELDMTVFNRSNDLIWGAYGSNVVHFSMLQEVVAAGVGVAVGEYTQVSSNTHVYERHYKMLQQFASKEMFADPAEADPYDGKVQPTSIIQVAYPRAASLETYEDFLSDCVAFCASHEEGVFHPSLFLTQFFREVVRPMYVAWNIWKRREAGWFGVALDVLTTNDCDWMVAAKEWLIRRQP